MQICYNKGRDVKMKRSEVDRSKLSPGMKQYMEIKDQYQIGRAHV